MPQANSTFSRPRATSPRASDGTLPCSDVRNAAISWRWVSTRFRIRNRISVRFDERRGAPARERGLRRRDRGVDLLDRREVDLAGQPPGRRVVDGTAPAGRPLDVPSADPVVDGAERRSCLRLRPGAARLGHLRHLASTLPFRRTRRVRMHRGHLTSDPRFRASASPPPGDRAARPGRMRS